MQNSKLKIKNSKLQRGYSLIELALYMGLLSILIVIMVELFVSSLKVQLDSQSASSVQQDARYILNKLSFDLTNAQAINLPLSLGETGVSLNIISSSGSNYVYNIDNGNLMLTEGGISNLLNSAETTVSNLSFQKLGNGFGKDSVQIKFTVTSKTKRTQGAEEKDFQTTILLR